MLMFHLFALRKITFVFSISTIMLVFKWTISSLLKFRKIVYILVREDAVKVEQIMFSRQMGGREN